jgi:hypothetical protein
LPGRCVRNKDLKSCTTSADCGSAPPEVCAVLKDSDGQRYCLPDEAGLGTNQHVTSLSGAGPRKHHQAYSRQLTGLNALGSICETDADCQPFSSEDPDARLCCQQIRRGRQGVRRICDRITAISVCTRPPKK